MIIKGREENATGNGEQKKEEGETEGRSGTMRNRKRKTRRKKKNGQEGRQKGNQIKGTKSRGSGRQTVTDRQTQEQCKRK